MIQENIKLSNFSTFGIGGNADFFTKIFKKEDLLNAVLFSKQQKIPLFSLGGGSNIVFSDTGIRGLVLHFSNKNIELEKETSFISVESGTRMSELYLFSKKNGFDFALMSTIPGTIGGALAGNAGLLGIEMKDLVISAELFDVEKNEFIEVSPDFFQFDYRKTIFHERNIQKKYIIWSVKIKLPSLLEEEINKKLKDYMSLRKDKQPWGKTGGSFFRNPSEGSAGMFLEKAGYKGKKLGGAFFSEKHANFLMNDGNATQSEIITLAQDAKKSVFNNFGVVLQNEVKIINEYGEICKI